MLRKIGRPLSHPFWGCEIGVFLPADEDRARTCIREGQRVLRGLTDSLSEAAARLRVQPPSTVEEARHLLAALKFVLAAPPLEGVHIGSETWLGGSEALEAVLSAGRRVNDLHRSHDATLKEDAWHHDVRGYHSVLMRLGARWWRGLSPTYRANKKSVEALCQGSPPRGSRATMALLDSILESQELTPLIDAYHEQGKALFGPSWNGTESDWKRLSGIAGWLHELHSAIQEGRFPQGLIEVLEAGTDVEAFDRLNSATEHHLADLVRTAGDIVAAIHLDEARRFAEGHSLHTRGFEEQAEILDLWNSNIARIHEIGLLSAAIQRMRDCGLANAVDVALDWPQASEHMVALLSRHWMESLIRKALVERPQLSTFDGEMHTHHLHKFIELDTKLLNQNRVRLAFEHWKSTPKYEAGGKLGILYSEFAKKRRHKPIRRLIQEAGRVIQVIKPVFMMSPLSIAMYLPPGSVEFDIVVFDEASQVKPVDAFGAILRAKQMVVVGDDRQLPPTTFFETGIDVDDDYSESVTLDLESILGLGLSKGIPSKMLRWHYRSRHESLITVSNHEFYDAKLTVFPSPDKDKRDVGLVYHYLPDTEYGRGGTRKNLAEARAVAEAVLQHARTSPDLTLGVAAFSISQAEAIRDQLEVLRRADPSTEAFFRRHPEEPFFVKNLENVQGDERDVILISVGYGRTAEGQISMNFGPLNSDGGERRLNVLITRARRRCEVFTNLKAEDIDLGRTRARGVEVLKRFLKYAESGSLDLPMPSEREVGSPFEAAVASRLRSKGYRVDHQVGTTGFFIDMAVVDDEAPGRYVLGIECDGASYHSARSARDRDRLRQAVLEALGWRIHRIWSTDWFRNPEREFQKLEGAIEAARLSLRTGSSRPADFPPADPVTEIERSAPRPPAAKPFDVQPYAKATIKITGYRANLHEVPARRMAEWIVKVVSVEAPVHEDEVIRRIAEGAGVQRIGHRIEEAFKRGVQSAVRSGAVAKKGPFLYLPSKAGVTLRSHSTLPNSSRDLALVAPEEIAVGVSRVAAASFGIRRSDLAKEVCGLFGFARVTEAMVRGVDKVIAGMIRQGQLVERGDFLTPPE
ncbi:MAG: DUF3320 domain-containing protein [Chloroflexi bacterium]|nr:DUF3320 domain-containing protein [Chloroflexota bacterium]